MKRVIIHIGLIFLALGTSLSCGEGEVYYAELEEDSEALWQKFRNNRSSDGEVYYPEPEGESVIFWPKPRGEKCCTHFLCRPCLEYLVCGYRTYYNEDGDLINDRSQYCMYKTTKLGSAFFCLSNRECGSGRCDANLTHSSPYVGGCESIW